MSQRRPLVVANWKMHYGIEDSLKFVTEYARLVKQDYPAEVVICPPFTSLYTMSVALAETAIQFGAQNCHQENSGAFTGEISADFLKEIGCTFVIIGHSERRHIFGETDAVISLKVSRVIEKQMKPIFCVGETDSERELQKTFDVITRQLETGLQNLNRDDVASLVIAYEPVWAIGTGKTATSSQAAEVHGFIRNWFGKKFGTSHAEELRILYGGSIKPSNFKELLAQPDIDGGLVGGASLKTQDFLSLVCQTA